jgi:glycosyltransferase involved in cell wall biosynthesis
MKVLHITPHLGGGVGKAHAALCAALPDDIEQTFLLLEAPHDCRHVDVIRSRGAWVHVADNFDDIAQHTRAADIVQFEFWNHPRLFECLARVDFPALRSVFWSHISGLFQPAIPPGLMKEAGRFVFSTEASLAIPQAKELPPGRVSAIGSGFGFAGAPARLQNRTPRIAYLGTVDFVKMHPGFFGVIDTMTEEIRVSVWGEPSEQVAARAREMRHPQRVRFHGQTATPEHALAEADIFFYPLQPAHYGTAENALVEAMSLGLVPVVLNNPAETAIVRDGETGLVAKSIEDCGPLLHKLIASPDQRQRLSRNAIHAMAETRTPARSAKAFVALWQELGGEAPRQPDFKSALGTTPADWFLATQGGAVLGPSIAQHAQPNKGTLSHFECVFTGDRSLAKLRASCQTA